MDLRKIDALVAEHVMGWTFMPAQNGFCEEPGWLTPYGKWLSLTSVPSYSKEIAVAWDVAEELNMTVHCVKYSNARLWHATDYIGNFFKDGRYASADTAPLAICLAALRIKGINYE